MDQLPSASSVLTKTQEFLSNHGHAHEQILTTTDRLKSDILPALESAKQIQSTLYGWEPPRNQGSVRKLKNIALIRMKNVVVSMLETTIMRQQKFNELVYQALVELEAENKRLQAELTKQSPNNT